MYMLQCDEKLFLLEQEDQDLPILCWISLSLSLSLSLSIYIYIYIYIYLLIYLFTPDSFTILMMVQPNLLTIDQIYLCTREYQLEKVLSYIKLPELVNLLCRWVKIGLATHGSPWYYKAISQVLFGEKYRKLTKERR